MMKLSLIAFALLACWAVGVLSEDLETAWEHHQAHFPVKASSAEEREKRRAIFAACHEEVEHHNKKNHTYKMALNIFSTMTTEEKQQFLGLNAAIARSPDATFVTAEDLTSDRQLPASVDLRTHKCMNSVKNQAQCGSCWAFAATAPVEFGTCLKTGTKVTLSEQQLVDCNTASSGCNGGGLTSSWTYLAKAGGQVTGASYPYTARTGTCNASKGVIAAKVSSVVTYAKDVTTMKTLLSQNRLLVIGVAIVKSFYSYSSGVYTEKNCQTGILGYHAMSVVGYGTLSGIDYWVVRNSWGSSWGAAGYILFQRGVDLCRIETMGPATANVI